MDDHELLREYVRSRSQDAFRELVRRHLAMVYSAAHRMVRDAHLAEEVAQNVFTTLARKAETLSAPQVVGGWLYNTTRHLAMTIIPMTRIGDRWKIGNGIQDYSPEWENSGQIQKFAQ